MTASTLKIDGPLQFGNAEQIKVIRQAERDAAMAEEEARKDTYEVTINFSGSFTVEVQASDEEEAREEAQNHWDLSEADVDTESVEIRKITKSEAA